MPVNAEEFFERISGCVGAHRAYRARARQRSLFPVKPHITPGPRSHRPARRAPRLRDQYCHLCRGKNFYKGYPFVHP